MTETSTYPEIASTYPSTDGPRGWPEGAFYRHDRGGHELLRVVKGISKAKAAEAARGAIELALVIDGPLIVVCSKAGESIPWAGSAYHWHRVRRPDRVLPPSGAETDAGSRLDLILMEARDGRVRAVRPMTLPLPFTRVLHEAILDQARYTYDPGAERRAMDALMRRCPTPNVLVAFATIRATIED